MKINDVFSLKVRVLDRYILGELKSPFFFGLVAFTTILVAGGLLFQMADLIIQKGVSVGIVIRLFVYYMPRLVVFTIPMSCLLASLLGFGKLSANSEIRRALLPAHRPSSNGRGVLYIDSSLHNKRKRRAAERKGGGQRHEI